MPNFFERLANAWHIFTLSLSFIGRDKSLLAVPILLILSAIAFGIGFVALLLSRAAATQAALVANFIIFLFVMYVWTAFLSSAQSWMVHEVAQGKDTTFGSGLRRAVQNLGDIFAYAFAILLIKLLVSWFRGKGRLGHAVGGILDYLSGVAGKLVVPAMIVTERSFGESVKQLGEAVKHIPEIAAFEVGIRPLTSLVVLLSIGIAVLFGLSFGLIAGLIIAAFLLLAVIILSTLVNQIYYTLLYLALIEKRHVPGLKLAR
jgi:hypothetical protein